MDPVEAALIARVRNGEAEAFRLVVDQYARPLHRLAYRLTRNEDDAEDVVQETFIRLFRRIDSFDGRSSFATWLHRVAANAALDLLRKRRPEEGEERLEEMHADNDSAQTIVDRLTVRRAVGEGMKSLSGKERTAFILRHYEGMSLEEIGQVLGTDTSATKNTIFRAVRKLRQILEPVMRSV
jgi:RNA polymerase sigma-70 factor (ECF subfamily)